MTMVYDIKRQTGDYVEWSRQMTILFGIGYYHRLNGAQLSLLALVKGLKARGHRPIVMFTGQGRCVEAYRAAGVEVRILRVPAAFNRYNKAWLRRGRAWRAKALVVGIPQIAAQVTRLIRDEHVDLVHCNEPRALLLFSWGALLARKRLVLHLRGSIAVYPPVLQAVLQAIPSRIILVGESLLLELSRAGRAKAVAIRNSVALPPLEQGSGNDVLTVLTLASLDPYKGYHHLVDAAAIVTARLAPEPVRFVWLGETINPAYEAYIRVKLAEGGLTNVALPGWQPDVAPYLEAADVVVQPTVASERLSLGGAVLEVRSAEGVPRAMIEAMAYGKPTVATRVGGIPEAVIDGETGLLVPPSDALALAEAILRLLQSPEDRARMGRAGRALAETRFSPEALVDNVLGLYRQLV